MSESQHTAEATVMVPGDGSSEVQARPGARRWAMWVVPVAPIVLAVGVALVVRHYGVGPAAPPSGPVAGIGSQAPGFSLRDVRADAPAVPVTLAGLVQKGPVVIIFHFGLKCPVCAQNLRRYVEQIEDFRKAGVQVVAISSEMPEDTRAMVDMLGEGGAFPFPLLWDEDQKVAQAFGTVDQDGTFVIDRAGRIQMAEVSSEPYDDISELLNVAKRSQVPR